MEIEPVKINKRRKACIGDWKQGWARHEWKPCQKESVEAEESVGEDEVGQEEARKLGLRGRFWKDWTKSWGIASM